MCIRDSLKDVKGKFCHDFAFRVVFEKGEDVDPKNPRYKSLLYGDKGGECDNAQTDERYQRCGFTTQLMAICFQDIDIIRNGGVDASTEEQFENNQDMQKEAIGGCETIVALHQGAKPPAAGVAYTKAAILAGYKKLFTVTPGGNNMVSWMVIDAEKEYLKNPIKFLQDHGQQWFFCKCKSSKCTIA